MSASFREDWQRGSMTLAIVFGVGLIGAVLVFLFTDAATPAPAKTPELNFATNIGPFCAEEQETAERVRSIVLGALDTALEQHVEKLFSVWISDGGTNPSRAANGVTIGSRSYLHAKKQIEAWDIPICVK